MPCHAHRRVAVAAAACLALAAVAAVAPHAAVDANWTLKIEPLDSPAGDASSAPQLMAQGDRAILSWMERAAPRALFRFSTRTASGWSAAKTVASGNDLVINAADVPSVRPLPGGSLAA